MNRPTPESDAAWVDSWSEGGCDEDSLLVTMQRLERERDEAREELLKLRIENNHNWQANEFAEEAMRDLAAAQEVIRDLRRALIGHDMPAFDNPDWHRALATVIEKSKALLP